MKIIKYREENTLRIALEGNLDAITTPQFQTLLRNSLDGITEVNECILSFHDGSVFLRQRNMIKMC